MPFSASEGDFRQILGVLHRVHKLSQSLAEEAKVWEECVLTSPGQSGDKDEGDDDDIYNNNDKDDDVGEADNDENPPPLQPVLVPSQLLSIMRDLRNEMISVLRLQGGISTHLRSLSDLNQPCHAKACRTCNCGSSQLR